MIIQTKYQYSDRELVEQLTENPYYQYFIGLPGYQEEPPIDASTLVLFRKRLKMDVMYQNKTHSVDNRIVSIAQPWIRPIVRGKIKSPVEFGAKFDLSIDDNGLGRIEKISYDAYNESTVLKEAAERFRERTGYYPERILADQIYRTRENRKYCKMHGIRLSDPKLGRPSLEKQSGKEKNRNIRITRIE